MSLFELGRSTGGVSLRDVLHGGAVRSPKVELSAARLAGLVCAGGWPEHHRSPEEQALSACRDYLENIRRSDLRGVDGVRRDPDRIRRFLRSLARNVATCASLATIRRDVVGPDGAMTNRTARDSLLI